MDREFSVLLYLSEEYTGGKIRLIDFDFKIQPKRGMLLAFPADHRYQHATLPVESPTPYVMVSWAVAKGSQRVKERPPYASVMSYQKRA